MHQKGFANEIIKYILVWLPNVFTFVHSLWYKKVAVSTRMDFTVDAGFPDCKMYINDCFACSSI